MRWYKRTLQNESAVLSFINILNREYSITPENIKIVGLTVYFYNDTDY